MISVHPPRPQWNHPDAKAIAAKECFEEVRSWASCVEAVDVGEGDREFLALLTLAMLESPDAYTAARYLEDFMGWPSDGKLVSILDRAYARLRFIADDLVHAWVMEHSVRFTAKKGQVIRCCIGDAELTVRVVDVIKREARCIAEPLKVPGSVLSVNAEEVLRVLPTGKKVEPHNFPTGGGATAAIPLERKIA